MKSKKEKELTHHEKKYKRMLNPLHNSAYSRVGLSYINANNKDELVVRVSGLSGRISTPGWNQEPFFKKRLEVYGFALVEESSPIPDLPNIETEIITKENGVRLKEVTVKLKEIRYSSFFYKHGAKFEKPNSFFKKLKIRVYYCEGRMVCPMEHSCDKIFIWDEWPDEPKDDSFLSDIVVTRNQTDQYLLLTDGHGSYLNVSTYFWDLNKRDSLAWFINEYVHKQDLNISNPLFKTTIEGLIKIENKYSLDLFIHAHQKYFKTALSEIQLHKKKVSHWMWFIFPQLIFMYPSEMSLVYSLDIKMMIEYRKNEYLMKNMEEMLIALLDDTCPDDANEVFGRDAGKLSSSLLFFIEFDSLIWGELGMHSQAADFVLRGIDELFKVVYVKFFSKNIPFNENYSFSAGTHLYILYQHYLANRIDRA